MYYHRARDGACRNHQLFATKLEERVWRDIANAIRDRERTRQAYVEAKANDEALTQRQRNHLAYLQANLTKLVKRKEKLDRMYSDPDLDMTKEEYLKQKVELDAERKGLEERIEAAQAELAKFPVSASLETFDAFMTEMAQLVDDQVDPSPEKQRQLLKILHVKVHITREGEPNIDGWHRLSSRTY